MKKKLFIVAIMILFFFVIILFISLKQGKKQPEPAAGGITQEQAIQQTKDDKISAEAINKIHEEYPWYEKIPIETADYRIVYNFDRGAFRIRLLKTNTPAIKQAAINHLESIGVDLKKFSYYFIEPEQPGFENLLR